MPCIASYKLVNLTYTDQNIWLGLTAKDIPDNNSSVPACNFLSNMLSYHLHNLHDYIIRILQNILTIHENRSNNISHVTLTKVLSSNKGISRFCHQHSSRNYLEHQVFVTNIAHEKYLEPGHTLYSKSVPLTFWAMHNSTHINHFKAF